MDEEFVICLERSQKFQSLVTHLPKHNITIAEYRKKYGVDVLIRSIELTKRRSLARKNRKGTTGKGETKIIRCPICSCEHTVSKFFALKMHDPRCKYCKDKVYKKEQDEKFNGLSEPEDYVICRECGKKLKI